ncbi:MAG: YopX family protein [Dehalococcoidales bacterium]|nr:YopX family protein [Dehalococcoidales bacterium]
MREIKFRAWDKEQKKMLYKDFCIIPTSPTWGATPIEYPDQIQLSRINRIMEQEPIPSDYTLIDWSNYYGLTNYLVLQYTGLKDKDWYESDLLLVPDVVSDTTYPPIDPPCDFNHISEIVFKEGSFGVMIKEHGDIFNTGFWSFERIITEVGTLDEVIKVGNIYENPELLT